MVTLVIVAEEEIRNLSEKRVYDGEELYYLDGLIKEEWAVEDDFEKSPDSVEPFINEFLNKHPSCRRNDLKVYFK